MKTFILSLLTLFSITLSSQNINLTNKVIPRDKIGVHNTRLKLNGFYYNRKQRINNKKDTINAVRPMILYRNGVYLGFHIIGNSSKRYRKKVGKQKCILKPRQNFDTIIRFFQCYAKIIERKEVFSVYSVDGNIIRIQHLGTSHFVEERGLILNDSTFLINQRTDYYRKTTSKQEDVYRFRSSQKPDSANFVLNPKIKSWFFK